MSETALITVTALPEIQENLRALRERWEVKALEAAMMVCTEDSVQVIKKMRSEMREEFSQADTQRKAAKQMYLAPWTAVEETFKECVSDAFKRADASFKATIDDFENELKAKCREDLERYFEETCFVYGVDFLTFDQAMALGKIRISLSDAKKKTPRQLQDELSGVVAKVALGVDQISRMEDAPEIMAEYKKHFDVGRAVSTVQERKREIEAEVKAADARKAAQNAQEAAISKVVAVATPLQEENALKNALEREIANEPIFDEFTFTVFNCKRSQLIKIRDYLKQEGIKYE